ncbi:MAG: GNAT family N-acetyltransferase [Betaproteobacteria bacterium]|nr:GNAT family N-acetyltransferase [Betaproteobacteria bacterium]
MSESLSWTRNGYEITTDRERMDLNAVHRFLSEKSYWARNIPRDVVERSMRGSLCFAILRDDELAGFARVTSDRATVAYLGDVFVLPAHRGKGLSKRLMECIGSHPELQGLRRWVLATSDAHGLYAQFGFTLLKAPERWMEKHDPDVYSNR